MITASGIECYPDGQGHPGTPTIVDVSLGLAGEFRFRRQTEVDYSVLCHSLVVARIIDQEYRLHGLLHDFAEAIMGDCVTSWKPEAFALFEGQLLKRFSEQESLPWPWEEQAIQCVKMADYDALRAEAHVLGHPAAQEVWPRQYFNDRTEQAMELTRQLVMSNATQTLLGNRDFAFNTLSDELMIASLGTAALDPATFQDFPALLHR